jgi:hypothetical protein
MRLKSTAALRRLARDERGFTMIFALMVMLVGSLLATAAFVATNEDVSLNRSYTSSQKAYFAALAGVDEYKFQLTSNPNYWLTCPASVNPVGGGEKVPVPGATEEEYAVKTIGANGHPACTSGSQATIIETGGTAVGTFRVEATGYSGTKTRSIVATFTHPGFLNYAWEDNFEVEDPSTFEPEPLNCALYYSERKELSEGKEVQGKKLPKELTECPPIPFIAGDAINGPFHTNDSVDICQFGGQPSFGRKGHEPPDKLEFNGGNYKSSIAGCQGGLTLNGAYTENGATLFPPSTDNELLETATVKTKGRTVIELESNHTPNTMTVTTYNFTTKKFVTEKERAWPTNGVFYAANEGTCGNKYSPFVADKGYEKDETEPNCGNVYVKGSYTESLTIAAQKDIIVIGSITTTHETSGSEKNKPIGNATLGLIANGFVRIYHPVTGVTGTQERKKCGSNENAVKNQTEATDPRKWGSLENPIIDAAILSTNNSWIVDNFNCGNELGTLTVWGVIAQYWRGRVTGGITEGGGGYLKSYNYDPRLQTKQPPNFLSPTTTDWKITRETQPCEGKTVAEGGRCPVL